MHCYLCFVKRGGSHSFAHALCQHCGAGVCADHLVALSVGPMYGMAGNGGPGWKLLCRHCYAALYPQAQSPVLSHRKRPSQNQQHWWQVTGWFRKKTIPDSPTIEEVIAEAELLLKQPPIP